MIRKIFTTPVMYGFRQNLFASFSSLKDFKTKLENKEYFDILGMFQDSQAFLQPKELSSRTIRTSIELTLLKSESSTPIRFTTKKLKRNMTKSPSALPKPTMKSRRKNLNSGRLPKKPNSSPTKTKSLRRCSVRDTTMWRWLYIHREIRNKELNSFRHSIN